MILNTYAVLMVFVGSLRLAAGALVALAAAAAWRANRASANPDDRSALESRSYLLFLLAGLLLILNLASWPLLYLLLQSYVPEWPGIMCIYGVTQVGRGALNSSRYLPDLLVLMQLAKPALVFLGGLWFVIYLMNRRARSAPLLGTLLALLTPFGALAAIDASAELAYVSIPKKDSGPSNGCCTMVADAAPLAPLSVVGLTDQTRSWIWYAAFYSVNLGMILALYACLTRPEAMTGSLASAALALGGVVTLATSGAFLVKVAAPTLLNLPYHHCAYDLIAETPEALAAIALFVAGEFFLGWAAGARWLANGPGTQAFLPEVVRRLLTFSLGGFVCALLMFSLELALA